MVPNTASAVSVARLPMDLSITSGMGESDGIVWIVRANSRPSIPAMQQSSKASA
jgi:hypothetical protein